MTWSKEERVAQLSRLLGITIADEDMAEVANRLDSLLGEMERLAQLDLSGIEPTPVFPDEDRHGG
jgi:Asp-tRNA(Asn)/Glu-tRNA(Gln) amidotransferase C subunit